MENLILNRGKKLDTTKIVRVGDISYFEGPILSLFEELNNGHLYLFDWVDRDHKFNRWIIYRVSPNNLLQFLKGKISHLELFESNPDKIVYSTDIDSNHNSFIHYDFFQTEELPSEYIPSNDNYFELSDCNAYEKIMSVIINSLSRQKYENEYSNLSNVSVLKQIEIKSTYYNRIPSDSRSYAFPIKRSESFNVKLVNNLTSNHVENTIFQKYSGFKLTESLKREEYANRYN